MGMASTRPCCRFVVNSLPRDQVARARTPSCLDTFRDRRFRQIRTRAVGRTSVRTVSPGGTVHRRNLLLALALAAWSPPLAAQARDSVEFIGADRLKRDAAALAAA